MHDVRGEQWVVASTAPVGSQAAAVESWSTGDGASIQMIFFRDRRAPPRHGDLDSSAPCPFTRSESACSLIHLRMKFARARCPSGLFGLDVLAGAVAVAAVQHFVVA